MKLFVTSLCLLLVGCEVKVKIDSKPIPKVVVPMIKVESAPIITTTEGTPSGEALGTVSPENNGFYIVCPPINGMFKLNGERFFYCDWIDNRTWGPEKDIITLKGGVIAYNVRIVNDKIRFSYWDSNKKGWYREMVGVDNGKPYFGNVEGQ